MIVVDSSTLILLAKCECLDMFLEHFKNCIISEAVMVEAVKRKNSFDSALIEKRIQEGKILVKKIKNYNAVAETMKAFGLEKGESETIVLAKELKAKAIATDDGKAIKAMKILETPFITALAFVLEKHKTKKIDKEKITGILQSLEKNGRYSKEIINFALKEVLNK